MIESPPQRERAIAARWRNVVLDHESSLELAADLHRLVCEWAELIEIRHPDDEEE